jgi:hypothetical protein
MLIVWLLAIDGWRLGVRVGRAAEATVGASPAACGSRRGPAMAFKVKDLARREDFPARLISA